MLDVVAAPVVGKAHVVEGHVGRVLARRGGGQGRFLGKIEHLGDALGRRCGLGEHHQHLVDGQHGVEDDGEVAQKGDDAPRLRQPGVDPERAGHHHARQSAVEQQAHQRIGGGHHRVGVNLLPAEGFAVPGETDALGIALGQGADDPHAGNVVAHGAHHVVHRPLHPRVERNAPPGDERDAQRQQRQRGQQHQTEPEVQHQRDRHAAQQQYGRAHAQALDAPEGLVDVVAVGGQAGDEAGHGGLIHLLRGQALDLGEEIVAQRARHVPGDGGGPAIGDHVAQQRQSRAQRHRAAPEPDGSPAARGRDLVDDVGEDPRNGQIHDRADELDGEADEHRAVIGAHIFQNALQASDPAFFCRFISL